MLLPLLLDADAPRVISVSSSVAAQGSIEFDDLQSARRYRFVAAYAQSKLATLMFALELDRRAKRAGTRLVSLATDPGIVRSQLLQRRATAARRRRQPAELLVAGVQRLFGQSTADGARASVFAATARDLGGGEYIAPSGWGHKRGEPAAIDIADAARDVQTAALLWERSVELTGVEFCPFGLQAGHPATG